MCIRDSFTIAVRRAICGNGQQEGDETCDDTNLIDGDGCSSTCQHEPVAVALDCSEQGACCVRNDAGALTCWGEFTDAIGALDLSGPFDAFSVNNFGTDAYVLAQETDSGTLNYLGPNDPECSQDMIPDPGADYTDLLAGIWGACALVGDGTMSCWGGTCGAGCNASGQYVAQDGLFKGLARGVPSNHNCAIDTEDQLVCWGCNNHGQLNAPGGVSSWLTVGTAHDRSWGLDSSGEPHLWGKLSGLAGTPSGPFVDMACMDANCCAQRADNTLSCWGAVSYTHLTLPTKA